MVIPIRKPKKKKTKVVNYSNFKIIADEKKYREKNKTVR